MKKPFWTSDKIVSFTAVFISLATLYIFVRQTNIIEEQSRMYVMPYLRLESTNDNKNGFLRFDIQNYGVGPAIIEKREIFYQGERFEMEFADFFHTEMKEMEDIDIVTDANIGPGTAIPSGGSRHILQFCDTPECHAELFKVLPLLEERDFDYRIQYRSIYGDRWEITSSGEGPVPVSP